MLSFVISRPRAAVLACLLGLGCVSTVVAAGTPVSNQVALEISTDGSCGNGITCEGSVWGRCCSAHGYCGNDEAYCGTECQTAFGACGLGNVTCPAPSDALPSTVTVSVCATRVTVTATRWETSLETVTVGGGGDGRVVTVTAPAVTSTVTISGARVSTMTVTVQSVVAGRTATVTATVGSGGRTATVTRSTTTIITLTSCSVGSSVSPTRGGQQGPSTKGPSTTVVVTTVIGPAPVGSGTATKTNPTTATVIGSQTKVPKPSPVLVGVISNCKKWHLIVEGDTCRKVSRDYNITAQQLQSWNPSLSPRTSEVQVSICTTKGSQVRMEHGICRVSCEDLWAGYNLCVSG